MGFPGETDSDFGQLVEFVEQQELDNVGIFSYSDEPLAASSRLPDHVGGHSLVYPLHPSAPLPPPPPTRPPTPNPLLHALSPCQVGDHSLSFPRYTAPWSPYASPAP